MVSLQQVQKRAGEVAPTSPDHILWNNSSWQVLNCSRCREWEGSSRFHLVPYFLAQLTFPSPSDQCKSFVGSPSEHSIKTCLIKRAYMIHIDFITRGKVSTCISTLKSYSEVKPQFPALHASPNTANVQGAREWAMDWVRCDRHGEKGPQETICSQPGRGWQQPHCSLEQGAPNGEALLSLIYTTPVSSSGPNRFLCWWAVFFGTRLSLTHVQAENIAGMVKKDLHATGNFRAWLECEWFRVGERSQTWSLTYSLHGFRMPLRHPGQFLGNGWLTEQPYPKLRSKLVYWFKAGWVHQ